MGEEERNVLTAKVDMILKLLEQFREDHQYCRTHCDSAMSGVFKRLQETEKGLHGLLGAKLNPHWFLVAAELIGVLVLVYMGVHR